MRKTLVIRTLLVTSASLLVALLGINPSQARTTDFGVRGGVYPDGENPFLGAEALFGVGESNTGSATRTSSMSSQTGVISRRSASISTTTSP